MSDLSTLRTDDVAAVLDAVRSTGLSAFRQSGGGVSDVVLAVAILRGRNPLELQDDVTAYADALDRAAGV